MSDPLADIMGALVDERQRLDVLLDEALEQYALYEEGMNARMKTATPEQMPGLLAERARIEDSLGIIDLVDRIDRIRERVSTLKVQCENAA